MGKAKRIVKILVPPTEEELGKLLPVCCEDCEREMDIWVSRNLKPVDGKYAICICKGAMYWNPSGTNILVKSSGPGVSSTSYGMRRARELTKKNERLAKSQWSDVEPMKLPEGTVPRNPTKGGPYDPNGPFAKKKKNKVISLPKS